MAAGLGHSLAVPAHAAPCSAVGSCGDAVGGPAPLSGLVGGRPGGPRPASVAFTAGLAGVTGWRRLVVPPHAGQCAGRGHPAAARSGYKPVSAKSPQPIDRSCNGRIQRPRRRPGDGACAAGGVGLAVVAGAHPGGPLLAGSGGLRQAGGEHSQGQPRRGAADRPVSRLGGLQLPLRARHHECHHLWLSGGEQRARVSPALALAALCDGWRADRRHRFFPSLPGGSLGVRCGGGACHGAGLGGAVADRPAPSPAAAWRGKRVDGGVSERAGHCRAVACEQQSAGGSAALCDPQRNPPASRRGLVARRLATHSRPSAGSGWRARRAAHPSVGRAFAGHKGRVAGAGLAGARGTELAHGFALAATLTRSIGLAVAAAPATGTL